MGYGVAFSPLVPQEFLWVAIVVAIVVAAPTVPVAVKVSGLPVSPVEVAVRVLVPAVGPSVQLPTVARPLAFVVRAFPVMLPPPDATAKVTLTLATGFPLASVTSTEGSTGNVVPATAV